MRILVVEDEQDLNNVICNKLRASGYSVDSCLNGEDALDYIRVGSYDGVLMDIMLPKINGLQHSSPFLIMRWGEMVSAGCRINFIPRPSVFMTSTTSWLRTKIKMQSLKTGVISSITLMPVSIFS